MKIEQLAIELWEKKKNVNEVIQIVQKIDSMINISKVYKWLKEPVKKWLKDQEMQRFKRINTSKNYGIDYKILCRWLNELGYKKFECKKKAEEQDQGFNRKVADEIEKIELDNSVEAFDKYEFEETKENHKYPTLMQMTELRENTKAIKGLTRAIYANFKGGQMELLK